MGRKQDHRTELRPPRKSPNKSDSPHRKDDRSKGHAVVQNHKEALESTASHVAIYGDIIAVVDVLDQVVALYKELADDPRCETNLESC